MDKITIDIKKWLRSPSDFLRHSLTVLPSPGELGFFLYVIRLGPISSDSFEGQIREGEKKRKKSRI